MNAFIFCVLTVLGFSQISSGVNTSPVCPSSFYTITIPEDTGVDSVIFTLICDDVDSGSNGTLTYVISSGNDDRKFNLVQTGTTATIKSAGTFDNENTNIPKSYSLEILSKDGGTPPLSVSVALDITLTPVNEFDPTFLSLPPSLVIDENTAVGTMILNTKPFDEDLDLNGKNQRTKTSLTSSDSPGMFYMDEVTGQIYLRQPVDYETSSFHSVILQIMDEGQPPQRSVTYDLNITIRNINDHPPVCPSQVYTVKIKENTPVGTGVIKLDCTDMETPRHGLVYKLHKGNHKKFAMEDHGELKLVEEIDTDKEHNLWTIDVEVRDKGMPRLDTFVQVNVFVEDVDDHKPTWHPVNNGSYKASIPENSDVGTFVAMVTALDYDKPGTEHSEIKYSIEDMTTLFTMERLTGKIIVASSDLDREDKDVYTLAVSAHSSTVTSEKIFGTVSITITDVNDNVPMFSKELYSASWSEDTAINTVLLNVQATDKDEGQNRKISYSIFHGNTEDGCRMSIDKNSGKISTDSQLDYERKQSCFLTVIASDEGSVPLVSSASVIISVTGVNEHTPVFKRQLYTVSVSEDTIVGTSLAKVEANDDDIGDDGQIVYIVASNSDKFTIDGNEGIVRLMTKLDSETTSSYLIEIQAVDKSSTMKKTGTTTMTILVDDVNEMAPSCKSISSVQLTSSVIVGDFVYEVDCVDNDVGPNGDLAYSITKGNTNLDFMVDSHGRIVVSKLPSKPVYSLEISVSDQGSNPLQTTAQVYVSIVGEPEFGNLPDNIEVNENEHIGFVIFTVQSKTSLNSKQFSIKSGNTDGVFGIDDISGNIYVIAQLDREMKQSYSLTIELIDNIVKLSSQSTLTVRILDTNDNKPMFSNSFYEFAVVENIHTQTDVGHMSASDADIGVNKDLAYAIESGNIGSTFIISQNGDLVLDKELDAESIADYTLSVTATDKGKPSLTGTTTVVVLVKDFDEFPTTFVTGTHNSYTIAENTPLGSPIFSVQAKDSDKDVDIQYYIAKGNDGSFIINKHTGEIILGHYIDRESTPEYNLTIVADNGAGDTTSTILTVTVTDINDNDPFCQQNVVSITVDESENDGSIVGILHCDDIDVNENAKLIYSITSGNTGSAFRLNESQIILNNDLDFETINNYILEIEVKDQGSPPRSSAVNVMIDVVPVYRSPKLYATNAQMNVSEGSHIGTVIFDVDATLDGATEGSWNAPGDLEYILQSIHNTRDFSVDINTGEITIASKLDRETIDLYTLDVKCVNKYNRNLYQTLSLEVNVIDVNDNAPLFSNAAYIFLVDEDAARNSVVGQLKADDNDIGWNADVEYAFIVGENLETFSIESKSGIIMVNNTLDASVKNVYVFSVVVTDNGSPPLSSTAKVMIEVNDINNNNPRFQQSSYYVDISENVNIGDVVYQLQADDDDEGSNGKISYSISSGNDDVKFGINLANGQITISERLDRESTDKYNLEIIAQDGGVPSRTSTTSLMITVMDINDNKPIFSRPIYDVKIDRYIPASTIITTVHATDLDQDLNAKIDFFIIEGNDENYFLANFSTGDIETVAPLYLAQDYYTLRIKAADNGYPRLIATSILNIAIYPSVINTGSHFEFSAPENASLDAYIGTVIPDGIHGQNGQAYYIIIGGNSLRKFVIDKLSGIIRTNALLDREDVNEYFLTIAIEDSVNNQINYHKLVHVIIEDINDNTPVFEFPYRVVSVVENSPIGLSIFHFNVTDKDIENNGNITLEIDPGDPLANTLFKINAVNSNLDLKIIPDYEMVTDHTFKVYAMDGGFPSRTATSEIVVNIIDVKDSKPYDDRPASYFSLECPINAKNGDRVTTFSPHDFGIFQSIIDPVKYLTINRGGVFGITPLTGEMYVKNKNFLYEGAHYVMWTAVQVLINDTWTGAAGIIRIDTLVPNKHLVVIEHDVPAAMVEVQRNKLKYALQDLFPLENRVGLWDIKDEDDVSGRRRILSIRSKTTVYVVKDRSTDTIDGLEKDKTFMTQDEILQVIRQSDDGTPAYPLKSKAFDTFPVNFVGPYHEDVPEKPAWYESKLGIAILSTVFVSFVLLAIILLLYFCCTRDRSSTSSKKFLQFPSSNDMLSDNEVYPYSSHPPPFKPWTGSCTSINGTQKHYLTRQERWGQLLDNAGFGFHSLRKPVGPPLHFHDNLHQSNNDLTKTRKQLNPWLINYSGKDEPDQPNKSLTAYTTKVQKYPSN